MFQNPTFKPSCQVKNLGVHFDNCMTFDAHISKINHKVMGTPMYINRVKYYFDEPTRILIIQSLVMNILNYCNTVWGTTNNTLLLKTSVRLGDRKIGDAISLVIMHGLLWFLRCEVLTTCTSISDLQHLPSPQLRQPLTAPFWNLYNLLFPYYWLHDPDFFMVNTCYDINQKYAFCFFDIRFCYSFNIFFLKNKKF